MTEKLSERMEKSRETIEKGLNEEPNNMAIPWIAGRLDAWIPRVEALEAEAKRQDGALISQENRYWEKVKELKDTESRLAKAQGLPKKWRKESCDGIFLGMLECADELEKALGVI